MIRTVMKCVTHIDDEAEYCKRTLQVCCWYLKQTHGGLDLAPSKLTLDPYTKMSAYGPAH